MLLFLLETFALGLKNLRLHKLRSLLTALGIIFGVSAVIIMVAIGAGAQQAAAKQMEQLGARNIVARSERPPASDEAGGGRNQRVLEYGLKRIDFERLKELPNIRLIVPLKDTEQRVYKGSTRHNANAIATHPDIFEVINLRADRGRLLNVHDYESGASICVIGATVAQEMFPFDDPLGQEIKVGQTGRSTVLLKVVGVLEPTGLRADSAGVNKREIDRDLYFPLSLARSAFGDMIVKQEAGSQDRRTIELSEVWIQTADIADVEPVSEMVKNVAGMMPGQRKRTDVDVKAPIEILRSAERLNRLFNFIMVGIASFSLVVGGIGIMNIMLATVTERTKEIGIRRALGAKRKHITLQFLIETTVISLSGGLLGISLGSLCAILLPLIVSATSGGSYPTQITTWSVIGSFAVSGLIGVGFGLYPAMQAARMNPIEALRHE